MQHTTINNDARRLGRFCALFLSKLVILHVLVKNMLRECVISCLKKDIAVIP